MKRTVNQNESMCLLARSKDLIGYAFRALSKHYIFIFSASIIRTIIMLATISSALLQDSKAEIFKPKTAKLENGLEIILVENHLSPVVSVALTYKVGTADDPAEMIGLSHFLEHLMFKGTKKVPSSEFNQRIISKGGNINAYTTPDMTVYTCDISVEHLDMLLEMEADRMQNLVFIEKETLSEQKVVMEERKMRLDNNPMGHAYETIQRALHKYHNYGIPTIGYPQHILAYTNESARQHYLKWYAPNNAILLISGDITMEELLPLVKKNFSSIPMRKIPPRVRFQDPEDNGVEQIIKVESPRISYVNMDWHFRGPRYVGGKMADMYALEVLAEVLGGNATSRLYKDLVDAEHMALSAYAHQDVSIDPQYIEISVTLHPSRRPEELRKAVDEHIRRIVAEGITEAELKAAKRDLLADIAYSRDGNSGAIDTFRDLAYGFSVEDIEAYPARINQVTLEQVQQAAKTYLGTRPAVITEIYPKGYKEPIGVKPDESILPMAVSPQPHGKAMKEVS